LSSEVFPSDILASHESSYTRFFLFFILSSSCYPFFEKLGIMYKPQNDSHAYPRIESYKTRGPLIIWRTCEFIF